MPHYTEHDSYLSKERKECRAVGHTDSGEIDEKSIVSFGLSRRVRKPGGMDFVVQINISRTWLPP